MTDGTGWGSYSTAIAVTFSKVIHLFSTYYFFPRLNFTDTLFAPMPVEGYSVYGGDPSTKGKIWPGNLFQIFIGIELSITEHWAIATDLLGSFYQKDRFKGTTGEAVGFPPATLFSAAPAIEYNWSNTLGLIVGSWFTFAGKNDDAFAGAAISVTFFSHF